MLEPFTITVGTLACINTAGKICSKGQELRHAPAIVKRIIEDVDGFKILASSIRDALQDTASSALITQDNQDRLVTLFERADKKLLQIDMILQYDMIDQQTYTQETKVSRLATVRKTENVMQLRQDFKDLTDGISKIWQAIIV